MTAVFINVYRQRTQPKIYEERSVQGQINQIILMWKGVADYKHKPKYINDVVMYWTWLSIFAITW